MMELSFISGGYVMAHQFTLTQHVNQSPDAVFYAFTNSPMLTEWWCDWAFLTPYRGRTLYMYWDTGFQAMGQYREVEPPERLAFTWIDGASPACNAAVTFTEADGGTRVELAYTGIDNENQQQQLETHWRQGVLDENVRPFESRCVYDTAVQARMRVFVLDKPPDNSL